MTMRSIYSILLYAGAFASAPLWLYRGLRLPKYKQGFRRRLGFYQHSEKQLIQKALSDSPIWIHAVSVGELLTAIPLIEALYQEHPQIPLVITCTTLTGHTLAQERLSSIATVLYAPLDFSLSVNAFLNLIRPQALIILETELWPNMIALSSQRGIPIALVNARLSDTSFRNYARFSFLCASMLKHIGLIATQSEEDTKRFLALGARPNTVSTLGNLKYVRAQMLRQSYSEDKPCALFSAPTLILLAASTHEGEEELVLNAYQELCQHQPLLKLILVPRHPERAADVLELCHKKNLSATLFTSLEPTQTIESKVLVVNVIGQLISLYRYADVVIIGGSFIAHGGQNPLEPAALGKPIVFGPHMFNFKSISRDLLSSHAAIQLADAAQLVSTLKNLLAQPDTRADLGRNALNLIDRHPSILTQLQKHLNNYLLNQNTHA